MIFVILLLLSSCLSAPSNWSCHSHTLMGIHSSGAELVCPNGCNDNFCAQPTWRQVVELVLDPRFCRREISVYLGNLSYNFRELGFIDLNKVDEIISCIAKMTSVGAIGDVRCADPIIRKYQSPPQVGDRSGGHISMDYQPPPIYNSIIDCNLSN